MTIMVARRLEGKRDGAVGGWGGINRTDDVVFIKKDTLTRLKEDSRDAGKLRPEKKFLIRRRILNRPRNRSRSDTTLHRKSARKADLEKKMPSTTGTEKKLVSTAMQNCRLSGNPAG